MNLTIANSQLKEDGHRTRLEPTSAGNYLRIRWSENGRLKRLSPHIENTEEGILKALEIAIEVSNALKDNMPIEIVKGRVNNPKGPTFKSLIRALMLEYRETHPEMENWGNDYGCLERLLPFDQVYSPKVLIEIVSEMPENSRKRLRAGVAMAKLARMHGDVETAEKVRDLSKGYKPEIRTKPCHINVELLDRVSAVADRFGVRPREVVEILLNGALQKLEALERKA